MIKYKKKNEMGIQCEPVSQYIFFIYSRIKKVYYVIITERKASSHENFPNMQKHSFAGVLQSRCS